jgi:hypothetical protein
LVVFSVSISSVSFPTVELAHFHLEYFMLLLQVCE